MAKGPMPDDIAKLIADCERLIDAFEEGSDYRTAIWWRGQPGAMPTEWHRVYREVRADVEEAVERVCIGARRLEVATETSRLLTVLEVDRDDEGARGLFVAAQRTLRAILLDAKARSGPGASENDVASVPLHSNELSVLMVLGKASCALTQEEISLQGQAQPNDGEPRAPGASRKGDHDEAPRAWWRAADRARTGARGSPHEGLTPRLAATLSLWTLGGP